VGCISPKCITAVSRRRANIVKCWHGRASTACIARRCRGLPSVTRFGCNTHAACTPRTATPPRPASLRRPGARRRCDESRGGDRTAKARRACNAGAACGGGVTRHARGAARAGRRDKCCRWPGTGSVRRRAGRRGDSEGAPHGARRIWDGSLGGPDGGVALGGARTAKACRKVYGAHGAPGSLRAGAAGASPRPGRPGRGRYARAAPPAANMGRRYKPWLGRAAPTLPTSRA
jgi:hypothetical protein